MKRVLRGGGLVLALACMNPAAGFSAGFGLFEQGSKATAMAGAFTATADDASAAFYNPAGLAFLKRAEFYGGSTLIAPKSDFEGANPFPGDDDRASQKSAIFTPVGMHYAQPLGENWVAAISVFTPFGLTTEWKDKSTFSGRFISQKAALEVISIQPTIAWKVSDQLSFGLGAEYRTATVELQKNVASVNPYTQQIVDIAHVQLDSTGMNGDWGFAAGILYKPMDGARIGLSYRHHIDVKVEGKGDFTQISTGYADFDAAVAAQLPFDHKEKVSTEVDFPSIASFGIAIDLTPDMTIETDADWTGWNRFKKLDLNFTDRPDLSSSVTEDYKTAWNFRIGWEMRMPETASALRLGYVYDQTPVPRESIGPLLPDADRAGYCIGWGYLGETFGVDLAYMYLTFRESRSVGVNRDGFNGSYETTANLLGIHARYRF